MKDSQPNSTQYTEWILIAKYIRLKIIIYYTYAFILIAREWERKERCERKRGELYMYIG